MDCRMDYIRLVVDLSHAVQKGSSLFLLRRDHGSLVPYIRSLMMALPGNHTMQLASEASRWKRKVQLWQMAKDSPGGTTVSSDCPSESCEDLHNGCSMENVLALCH